MAQIVCIKKATIDINKVGDIIALHEDDVALTYKGYTGFEIIVVKGKKKEDINKLIFLPEINIEENEGEEVKTWKDEDGVWKQLIKEPKYSSTTIELTIEDKEKLSDEKISSEEKDTIIKKIKNNISLDEANQTIVEGNV